MKRQIRISILKLVDTFAFIRSAPPCVQHPYCLEGDVAVASTCIPAQVLVSIQVAVGANNDTIAIYISYTLQE